MSQQKRFKDFGIKVDIKSFVGEKIAIKKILNKEITVEDFEIVPSKYSDFNNDKCLKMQITFNNEKRVIFTGSNYLMDSIKQVNKSDFPFQTTIIEIEERYEFT